MPCYLTSTDVACPLKSLSEALRGGRGGREGSQRVFGGPERWPAGGVTLFWVWAIGETSGVVRAKGGLYQLVVWLEEPCEIAVGGLGKHLFPAGYYIYTGSAKRSIEARVRRHLRRSKRLHWHIDYLLEVAEVVEVVVYPGATEECVLNTLTAQMCGAVPAVRRFGSSDCKCAAHLLYCGLTKPAA